MTASSKLGITDADGVGSHLGLLWNPNQAHVLSSKEVHQPICTISAAGAVQKLVTAVVSPGGESVCTPTVAFLRGHTGNDGVGIEPVQKAVTQPRFPELDQTTPTCYSEVCGRIKGLCYLATSAHGGPRWRTSFFGMGGSRKPKL